MIYSHRIMINVWSILNSDSIGKWDLYFDTNKTDLISLTWYFYSRPELENLTIVLVFILTSPFVGCIGSWVLLDNELLSPPWHLPSVSLSGVSLVSLCSGVSFPTWPVSLCHQDGRRQAVDSAKPQLDPSPSRPQVVDGQPGRDLPTAFYSSGLSCWALWLNLWSALRDVPGDGQDKRLLLAPTPTWLQWKHHPSPFRPLRSWSPGAETSPAEVH